MGVHPPREFPRVRCAGDLVGLDCWWHSIRVYWDPVPYEHIVDIPGRVLRVPGCAWSWGRRTIQFGTV